MDYRVQVAPGSPRRRHHEDFAKYFAERPEALPDLAAGYLPE